MVGLEQLRHEGCEQFRLCIELDEIEREHQRVEVDFPFAEPRLVELVEAPARVPRVVGRYGEIDDQVPVQTRQR